MQTRRNRWFSCYRHRRHQLQKALLQSQSWLCWPRPPEVQKVTSLYFPLIYSLINSYYLIQEHELCHPFHILSLKAILSTGSLFHMTLSVSGARTSFLTLWATLKSLSILISLPMASPFPTPSSIYLAMESHVRSNIPLIFRRAWT